MLVFLDGAGPPLSLPLHRAGTARATLLFRDGAGPSLSLPLHCAGMAGAMLLFRDGARPPLDLALHCTGMAPGGIFSSARLALRRTLSAGVRGTGRPHLLGCGQTAAAQE
ncbi:MAG: hypothetical protein WBF43_11315 [Methylocella sp.]